MPRTFTLAGLLFVVTLFSITCGLAMNFCALTLNLPEAANGCAIIFLFFAPIAIVWLVLSRFAKWPGYLAWNISVGAFIGFIAAALFSSGPPFEWPLWLDYLMDVAPSTVGAFVFGIVGLLDEQIAPRRD